jgi:hypothetical protein
VVNVVKPAVLARLASMVSVVEEAVRLGKLLVVAHVVLHSLRALMELASAFLVVGRSLLICVLVSVVQLESYAALEVVLL